MMVSCKHDYRYFIVPGRGFTPVILHTPLVKEVSHSRSGVVPDPLLRGGCSVFLRFLICFGEWMIRSWKERRPRRRVPHQIPRGL